MFESNLETILEEWSFKIRQGFLKLGYKVNVEFDFHYETKYPFLLTISDQSNNEIFIYLKESEILKRHLQSFDVFFNTIFLKYHKEIEKSSKKSLERRIYIDKKYIKKIKRIIEISKKEHLVISKAFFSSSLFGGDLDCKFLFELGNSKKVVSFHHFEYINFNSETLNEYYYSIFGLSELFTYESFIKNKQECIEQASITYY